MGGLIEPNVFLSSLRFVDFDTKIWNSGQSKNKLGVRNGGFSSGTHSNMVILITRVQCFTIYLELCENCFLYSFIGNDTSGRKKCTDYCQKLPKIFSINIMSCRMCRNTKQRETSHGEKFAIS